MGAKVDTTTSRLITSLDTDAAVQSWIDTEVNHKMPTYSMGTIIKINESSSGLFDLLVNFSFNTFDIYSQLNQFHHLGYQIPSSVLLEYQKVNQLYPLATGVYDHIQLLNKIFNHDLRSKYGESYGFSLARKSKSRFCTKRDS